MGYRILLVEDEGLIRITLAETLEEAGYSVTEAVNGDEACRLLRDADEYDVLLTDIQMPGKADGIEVARNFHQQRPTAPVVFMTGRPDTLARVGTLGACEALLRKPFGQRQMLEALMGLLEPHA